MFFLGCQQQNIGRIIAPPSPVTSAERSKEVVMLLLIHCLLLSPLFCWSCVLCITVVSSFVMISLGKRKRESWLFNFKCLLMSFVCKCSGYFPHGAVCRSAVYDCRISRLYLIVSIRDRFTLTYFYSHLLFL